MLVYFPLPVLLLFGTKLCKGCVTEFSQVIPPGMEFHNISSQDGGDLEGDGIENEENTGTQDPPIWSEVKTNPCSPSIFDCTDKY